MGAAVWLLQTFFFTFIPVFLCDGDLIDPCDYQRNWPLSEGLTLYFRNTSEETVQLAVKARTEGWVAFGLSREGEMEDSDVWIAASANSKISLR